MLGQPRSAGQLQRDQEEPFFRTLAERTGLPLVVRYLPADAYGLKDNHQLEAIRDGRLDIVSLRFMQNMEKEPGLEGMDLPGMVTTFAEARQVARAYSRTLDRYLQSNHGGKLLGIWSFGPQVMFCRRHIDDLRGISGRRIRVASPGLAKVIAALGGIPVVLPFADTREALALGMVDCGVTSAASGAFAGWGDYTESYYPLVFQFGFNGYVMSLKRWNLLSSDQKDKLEKAFQGYNESLWRYSETLQRQSERCILSGHCQLIRSARHRAVPVKPQDIQLLQSISQQIALPSWLERCQRRHPDCRQAWQRDIAPFSALPPQAKQQ
ncbi:MAG: TRAP transporter substrate-binding protein DctP [Cyanobium sp.]